MASPFKLFRKYQKTAFVLLGVMAMVSFIVLPAYLQYAGTSSSADVTFATSRFGKINAARLASITREVSDLARFYDQLNLEIQRQHQMNCVPLQNASYLLRQMEEEQAVEQWLIAQYMYNEGFKVSRQEVGDYISKMTMNREMTKSFTTEKLYGDVLKSLNISNDYVAYLVGNRILLDQFAAMSGMSVAALPPTAEFDWYNRFNSNMRVEAIPVSVGDFTSQVDAPTKKQLKAFFEENRFRDRNPRSLESGFGWPKMAQGEYIYFDKSMLDTESITDEEVVEYYEANKELFVERSTAPTPGFGTIPTPGASGTMTFPGMGTGIGETELTAPSGDTVTIPLVGPTDETTAEQPDDSAVTETPDTEETPAGTSDEAAPEQTSEPTSWNRWNMPVRLVSYQSENGDDAATSPEADAVAEPVAVTDAAATDNGESTENTETPADNPVTDTPATDTPLITLPPGSTGGLGRLGGGLPSVGQGAFGLGGSTNPALASTPVTYRPLDDTLKTEIREMIARERMQAKFKQIDEVIADYFSKYMKSQQEDASDVPLPDLASLAQSLGLNYVNLAEIDFYGLIDKHYDFASSVTTDSRAVTVVQGIFSERGTIIEKKAYRSAKSDEKEYLFWMTKIAEPRIPNYDDPGMAEQVEARWREVQARPLAQKKAEELAEAAAKSDGMLLEYFTANPRDDVKDIVGTEFFTWKAYDYSYYHMLNNAPPTISLGEVRETGVMTNESIRDNKVLKNLGEEFMEAVYHLKPGEITVTHNASQDTFYVVRLIEVTPDDEAAFDAFTASAKTTGFIYNQAALQDRQRKVMQGALKKVFEATKFAWKVKPSEYQQQERLKNQERQQQPDRDNSGGNVPPNVPRF